MVSPSVIYFRDNFCSLIILRSLVCVIKLDSSFSVFIVSLDAGSHSLYGEQNRAARHRSNQNS